MKAIHLFLSGNVQGVGFRYTTKQLANEFEINGAVKNREDGRVEIWAEGEEEQLTQFINALKDAFPTQITKSEEREQSPQNFSSFEILH